MHLRHPAIIRSPAPLLGPPPPRSFSTRSPAPVTRSASLHSSHVALPAFPFLTITSLTRRRLLPHLRQPHRGRHRRPRCQLIPRSRRSRSPTGLATAAVCPGPRSARTNSDETTWLAAVSDPSQGRRPHPTFIPCSWHGSLLASTRQGRARTGSLLRSTPQRRTVGATTHV